MKRIVLTVFILLLSPNVLFGVHTIRPALADTIDVFPGESIQEAINSALPGDTVFVHVGVYAENLLVGKTLTLIGESKGNTIIDGSGKEQSVVEVTASQVVITGFTVQNTSREAGTSFAGIKISGAECNVTGNHVRKSKIGISVTSHGTSITENVATENGHGIALYSSTGAFVESNNVSRNTVGISLAFSSGNTILGNRAINSSTGGHGIYISSSLNNTVLANELRFNYHGMWLSASSDNWIVGNLVANNELLGIELANSPQNTFFHNSFADNSQEHMRHIKIDDKSDSIWDNDYPSGGNFWHGFDEIDEKSGVDQDQPGSDGMWDNPYTIDMSNRDNYPLVWPPSWENELPPLVTILSPRNQTYPTTSILLNYSVNKPTAWIGYSLDDGTNVTITGIVNLTLSEGPHNILLYANDTAGRSGLSRKAHFTIDVTPPQIIDISQQPLESNVQPEDEVMVNVTAADELSGIRQMTLNYTTNNGTWSIVNLTDLGGDVWSGVIPAFPSGTNVTYVIIGEDNVGNLVTTEDLGYELKYPVIPELSSPILLPLFTTATLLAALFYTRRRFT